MKSVPKVRIWIASSFFLICFFFASWRLVHLQITKHEHFAGLAANMHGSPQTLPARRGAILDVRGEPLAMNEPLKNIIADASLIKAGSEVRLAAMLSPVVGLSVQQLLEKFATGKKYIPLCKKVDEATACELQVALASGTLRGITFEQDARRIYPNGNMLCHVLGFLGMPEAAGKSDTPPHVQGVQGIEKTMEDYLRGYDGFFFTERDRKGQEIVAYRQMEKPARDGYNVRLTVDMALQSIVESELDAAVKQYNPTAAIIILMDPKTGSILAMGNRPSFDPNALLEAKDEQMKNRAIIDMVEPGSTFKIVTAAAALNEKTATLDSTVFCNNGSFAYGGRTLRDHHGFGNLTVEDVLAKSSNIGSAKLAMGLGDLRLYEYVRRFGFGERTGVFLPGEINGTVHPPHKWSKISITRIPMGHEVAVTPLQIATAMCVIANGGKLMMPRIIDSVTDAEGNVVQQFDPIEIRRVIEPETAAQIAQALKKVVSKQGTAILAKVPGFDVAGKTGTAQKVDPKGGYTPGKYVVSFLGYMPVENPRFVGLVMLDDAKASSGLNYGGLIAAPIFRQIAEKAARHFNLEPQPEEPDSKTILTKSDPPKKRR